MITLQGHSQFQIRCLHMMKERKKQRFVEKILRSMRSNIQQCGVFYKRV